MDDGLKIQNVLNKHANNYNKEIGKIFKGSFGYRVLEVGCSIGNLTGKFLDDADFVYGIDVVSESIEIIKKKYAKYDNFKADLIDIQDKKILELKKYKFDTVFCSNVLEHVKDDMLGLKHMYELLIPGGHLLLLVPALSFLYGSMDKTDHHFRRYDKKRLRLKLMRAGFKVELLRYMNFVGMIGWYVNGKILKRKILPAGQLGFYDKLIPFFFSFEKLFGPPLGLSLVAICKK